MTDIHAQDIMAGIALIIFGVLAGAMCFFPVPPANHDFLIYILGTISGALTLGGGQRAVRGLVARSVVPVEAPSGPEA